MNQAVAAVEPLNDGGVYNKDRNMRCSFSCKPWKLPLNRTANISVIVELPKDKRCITVRR